MLKDLFSVRTPFGQPSSPWHRKFVFLSNAKNCNLSVYMCWGNVGWLERKIRGRKFFDFISHYFEFVNPHPVSSDVDIVMKSKLLFLMEHICAEDACSLRNSFNEWLKNLYDVDFADILHDFTFVTDCASTLPCIAKASSSSSKVPFNERWQGYICHQISTFMKRVKAT